MNKTIYDVIIVGGGVMGCAAAYYLISGDDKLKIAVIERNPTYSRASTTLSMANVRIQFSLKENIQISRYADEVFREFDNVMAVDGIEPGIHFRREGNLFLVAEVGAHQRNSRTRRSGRGRRSRWSPGRRGYRG